MAGAPAIQAVHQELASKTAQLSEVVDELVYQESMLAQAQDAKGGLAAAAGAALQIAAEAANAAVECTHHVAQAVSKGRVEPQVRC